MQREIYLDNAASSWPKPQSVYEAMDHFSRCIGANPGRSAHRRSTQAARVVLRAREALAELFRLRDPARVVLTANATSALNLALWGLLQPGDHVVTSSWEHNSVMRPLRALQARRGIRLSVVPPGKDGAFDLDSYHNLLRQKTRAVVVTHGSNVSGALLPIAEIVSMAKDRGAVTIVDAAQTAGCVPIHLDATPIDLLAVTGHKGLLGPQGTGALCIAGDVDLEPLMHGGTGSDSEQEHQPRFLPDRHESGTLNTVGIAGLAAGVEFVLQQRPEQIWAREHQWVQRLLEQVRQQQALSLYGPEADRPRLGLVSLNVQGMWPSDVGLALEQRFGILTRVGLHCAPAAHRALGTFPTGTVRLSVGWFTTLEDVDYTAQALAALAAEAR